ncbi:MAG: alpha/beta fold hydrolase [Magnetococcales bacterium]|nr:alpha/beta fold hydrolase [Magnetococcales bacterium]
MTEEENPIPFTTAGQGPPVLCLPGFASGAWIFERVIEPLTPWFQLILPENRGMGRAPPAESPYALDDLAADALGVMDRLGHRRFGVIGLSMGGFVAQLLALRAPERLGAMALLGTSSGGPEFARIFPLLPAEQVRNIYQMEATARIQAALAPTFCPLLQSFFPEVHGYIVQRRLEHEERLEQVMRQYDAVERFLRHPLPLERIAAPTLILGGDQDRLVPPANVDLLGSRIPGSERVHIAGTDHLFFLEKSAEVGERIREFFQRRWLGEI